MPATIHPLPDDEEDEQKPDESAADPDVKPDEAKPPADDVKPDEKPPADETGEDEDDEEDVPLGEAGIKALNAEREKVRTIRREVAELRKTQTELREEVAQAKSVVVKAHARAAFAQAELLLPEGKETRAVQRALKLLDLDKVTITADGEAEGLAEQIAELREDYPELFARKRTYRRVDAADRGGDPAPKSSAERLLAQRAG